MGKITESTLIPLSLVILLGGGIAWAATLNAKASSNERALDEIKAMQFQYNQNMEEVGERLARIEGAMGLAEKKK